MENKFQVRGIAYDISGKDNFLPNRIKVFAYGGEILGISNQEFLYMRTNMLMAEVTAKVKLHVCENYKLGAEDILVMAMGIWVRDENIMDYIPYFLTPNNL